MVIGLSLLLVLVGGGGCYLCARNAYVGVRRGAVLVRSATYTRIKSPTYFFIGVTLAVVSAALLFIFFLAGVYLLISLPFAPR